MALSNAERQQRYRERRKTREPARRYVTGRTQERRSRVQRWQEAAQALLALQQEYQAWYDKLPESLQTTTLAEKLEVVCTLDLDEIASLELPLGFGRDEPCLGASCRALSPCVGSDDLK